MSVFLTFLLKPEIDMQNRDLIGGALSVVRDQFQAYGHMDFDAGTRSPAPFETYRIPREVGMTGRVEPYQTHCQAIPPLSIVENNITIPSSHQPHRCPTSRLFFHQGDKSKSFLSTLTSKAGGDCDHDVPPDGNSSIQQHPSSDSNNLTMMCGGCAVA